MFCKSFCVILFFEVVYLCVFHNFFLYENAIFICFIDCCCCFKQFLRYGYCRWEDFGDVEYGDANYQAISYLQDANIVKGYEDGLLNRGTK